MQMTCLSFKYFCVFHSEIQITDTVYVFTLCVYNFLCRSLCFICVQNCLMLYVIVLTPYCYLEIFAARLENLSLLNYWNSKYIFLVTSGIFYYDVKLLQEPLRCPVIAYKWQLGVFLTKNSQIKIGRLIYILVFSCYFH